MACLDTFVLSALVDGSEMSAFGVMRVLRVARLARIFRLLRFFKELWLLVAGIFDAMRTLFWAWTLITLLIYIFGIFTTRMIGQAHIQVDEIRDYFGDVPKSMFTLFQVMTTE